MFFMCFGLDVVYTAPSCSLVKLALLGQNIRSNFLFVMGKWQVYCRRSLYLADINGSCDSPAPTEESIAPFLFLE